MKGESINVYMLWASGLDLISYIYEVMRKNICKFSLVNFARGIPF